MSNETTTYRLDASRIRGGMMFETTATVALVAITAFVAVARLGQVTSGQFESANKAFENHSGGGSGTSFGTPPKPN